MSGIVDRRTIRQLFVAAAIAAAAMPCTAGLQNALADETAEPDRYSAGMLQLGYESISVDNLGDLKALQRSGWTARAVRPLSIGAWHITLNLAYSRSDNDITYDGHNAFVRLADRSKVSHLHLRVAPAGNMLAVRMGLTARQRGETGTRWSAGISVHPLRTVTLGVDHDGGRELISQATAMYGGDGGEVTLTSKSYRSRWRVRWSPARNWSLRTQLAEWIVAGADTHAPEYAISPTGRALLRSISLERAWSDHSRCVLTFGSLDLAGRLDAYTAGRSFGQFGMIRAAAERWSLDYNWNRHTHHLGIRLIRGEGSAYMAGVVKAWPFTEGLAGLLGQRRHIVLDGRLTWWQLRLTAAHRPSSGLAWSAEADIYRLSPELHTVTWQPLFLGVGIDDLRTGALDIRGADLARVTAGLGMPLIRPARLNLEVRQWIPLRITHDNKETEPAGSESTTSGKSASSASGGTFMSARLELPL